jgi:hypothetical protein
VFLKHKRSSARRTKRFEQREGELVFLKHKLCVRNLPGQATV